VRNIKCSDFYITTKDAFQPPRGQKTTRDCVTAIKPTRWGLCPQAPVIGSRSVDPVAIDPVLGNLNLKL